MSWVGRRLDIHGKTAVNVPSGSGLIVWLVVAAIFLSLYFVVRNTRRKSYDAYWDRKQAEVDRRNSDPDMRSE